MAILDRLHAVWTPHVHTGLSGEGGAGEGGAGEGGAGEGGAKGTLHRKSEISVCTALMLNNYALTRPEGAANVR